MAKHVALTNDLRAEILGVNDDYARGALRVLALARRDLPPRSGAYTSENIECESDLHGFDGNDGSAQTAG